MNYIVTSAPEAFRSLPSKSGALEHKEALSEWDKVFGTRKADAITVEDTASVEFRCISFEEGLRALHKWKDQWWAADSETTGLDWLDDSIFCVQLGTGDHNFIFDFDYRGIKTLKPESLFSVFNELGMKFVFHNAGFDLNFWMKHGFIPVPGRIKDTMIASQMCYNGLDYYDGVRVRHSFGAVMKRELGLSYDKTEQANIAKTKLRTKSAISYCFNDVDKLLALNRRLEALLQKKGLASTYQLQMEKLCVVEYTEQFGMPISYEAWEEKCQKDEQGLNDVKQEVIDYIWENLPKYRDLSGLFDGKKIKAKLSSPAQMIPVFKDFGIDVSDIDKKTREKKDSINKKMLALQSHEFVKLWLKYSDAQGNVTKFGRNILNQIKRHDLGGTIFTHFKLIVDTGRVAAGGKSMKQKGAPSKLNALNLRADKATRACFKAWEGHSIIVADYTGQETVILADQSLCPTMMASVLQGLDLHCAFARMVYPELAGLTDDEIKRDHKKKRDSVKAPRFAFSYGAGAKTIQKSTGLSLSFCRDLEKIFKQDLHAEVFKWGDAQLKRALETGFVESADGWKLYLPDWDYYKKDKAWWNNVPKETKEYFYRGRNEFYESQDMKARKEELIEKRKKEPLTPEEVEELDLVSQEYEIKDIEAWTVYDELKGRFGRIRKYESDMLRICLNNPIQTTGSHMTARAKVAIYKHILQRGHYGKVFIWNFPYDEICMMAPDELVEEYKEVLENSMRTGGNMYLKHVKISADADIGPDWYNAKVGG